MAFMPPSEGHRFSWNIMIHAELPVFLAQMFEFGAGGSVIIGNRQCAVGFEFLPPVPDQGITDSRIPPAWFAQLSDAAGVCGEV